MHTTARRKKVPDDDIPQRVLLLLLEQVRAGHFSGLLAGGAWAVMGHITYMRPSLAHLALEQDVCGIAAARLSAIGSRGGWVVRLPYYSQVVAS